LFILQVAHLRRKAEIGKLMAKLNAELRGEASYAAVSIRRERTAGGVSIAGRSVIILFELVIVALTSSQALLIDMAFDIAELATVILGFILVPKWFSRPDERRPYGLAQGETWLVIVRVTLAIAMGILLVVINVIVIMRGGNEVEFDDAAILELASAALAVVVTIYLHRSNRRLGSPSVEADIESWKIDIYASVAIGITFILAVLFEDGFLRNIIPHIDPAVAIIFSLVMMVGPARTLIFELKDLTLVEACAETVEKVNALAGEIIAERSLGTPEFYILETGRKTWVSIYITGDGDTISKSEYADVQREIYGRLSGEFLDIFVEVLPAI
jgi:predicted Co/Zn/Cd cation transporter (cation efflux family)